MVHEHASEQSPDKKSTAPARTPAPRGRTGLTALQGTVGNAAVVRMLQLAGHPEAARHQHGAGCGHGPIESDKAESDKAESDKAESDKAESDKAGTDRGAPEAPAVQRSAVHDVLAGAGRPLDSARRAEMESRLGADFSDVRIHDDSAARASAAEVGARAYTSGSHVVIGAGGGDKHTLAHELTHVVQQRQGPVAGTDNGAGLKVSDPSDRFEREAEANARRVMAGPAPDGDRQPSPGGDAEGPRRPTGPAAGPHGPEPVPVARLVSAEAFREQSKVSLTPRPDGLKRLDALLEAYPLIEREQFAQRNATLADIVTEADLVLSGSLKEKRRQAVTSLRAEAEAERSEYRRLSEAVALPPTQAPRRLLGIYEDILGRVQGPDGGGHLGLLSVSVSQVLQRKVGELLAAVTAGRGADATPAQQAAGTAADAALRAMLEEDKAALVAMAQDPAAPAETRAVLAEVTGLYGRVDLTVGMPGTRGVDGRYKMSHALTQPEGTVERLGSLAHEMTHVAAGESYSNTAILLLCRSDLGKEQMRTIGRERAQHADDLKTLLTDDMVTPRQRRLIVDKIDYITKPGQLGRYVGNFRDQLDAENPEKAQALAELAKEELRTSASLVEYDTVLTQLLVYLHAWRVPHDHPFHAQVRVLAEAQRNGRLEAAPADA